MKIAVLGAGSWGTAIASVLCLNEHDCILWAKRQTVVDEIETQHTNHQYLPGYTLPDHLRATNVLEEALTEADMVIYAVPSASMSEVVRLSAPYVPERSVVAHAVKGFDMATQKRMSEVILDAIPNAENRLAVIAGPSHAEEVIQRLPTTIVVAAYHRQTAEFLQDALMCSYLRVYTNPDVVGAELGGSLKNIIALGVGMADGLGYGDNAKAALMTRGLAEISRLGLQMGASPMTFAGLSGVGDLIVTCTSRHSRNFRAGRLIGQGIPLPVAMKQIGMAVEGVGTTRVAVDIARDNNVEMPIAAALAKVMFENMAPTDAVEDLMGRAKAHEVEEVALDQITPSWLVDN